MRKVLDRDTSGYSFELVPEVLDKIHRAGDLHQLIREEQVRDLEYVDISNKGYRIIKRILDVVVSFAGLCLLLVPMLLIAAVVYIDDPGPVFFAQYRIGRFGKRFKLYKIRTMKKNTPKYLATKEVDTPDAYITRVGRFLRMLSLDEIPQLLNVIKGDMSMIGPRPLITDEYELHAMRMRFGVYDIRPGITGLAQINGRDQITAERKLRWDVEYLKKFSFWTDLKILFTTIPKTLSRDGFEEGMNTKECGK